MAQEVKRQSAKDKYMERVRSKNPDLNFEDEDAFYENANQRMDDYDALNESVGNIREVMDANPYFGQMMAEAKKNKDLDPVIYLIENGLDIDALLNDEEYKSKLAEARADWLEKHKKAEELEQQISDNLPSSIDACKAKGKEMGLSDEDTDAVIERYFGLLDDIEQGILSPDVFEMLAKGKNYDADVATATKQGEANGRAQKIKEIYKKMPRSAARSFGVQNAPMAEQPRERESNMFGL